MQNLKNRLANELKNQLISWDLKAGDVVEAWKITGYHKNGDAKAYFCGKSGYDDLTNSISEILEDLLPYESVIYLGVFLIRENGDRKFQEIYS